VLAVVVCFFVDALAFLVFAKRQKVPEDNSRADETAVLNE
jgi:hypothetical protein